MRVLVACEFSGTVRDAFAAKGHDAWSCDLLDTETKGNHIKGDVLEHLDDNWDLMIAHPPCTYLTNAGVRHLHDKVTTRTGKRTSVYGSERWVEMHNAAVFFRQLLLSKIPKICVENPVPHKYAKHIIGEYTQLIQPWQFGHGETKATCLWLRNLPTLVPTNIVSGRKARIHNMPPSKDRWKKRSVTYKGIAEAMADQWG
jgi:hypothetical protein